VPQGTYGRIAPRSGLTVKYGLCVGGGVLDEDYSGEVKVVLFNHGPTDFDIRTGDRIAQLILEKIEIPEVTLVNELEQSDRGSGGFGSTGR
jgi:dUTP pyrophosphatase